MAGSLSMSRNNNPTLPLTFDAASHAHTLLTELKTAHVSVTPTMRNPEFHAAVTMPLRVIYI